MSASRTIEEAIVMPASPSRRLRPLTALLLAGLWAGLLTACDSDAPPPPPTVKFVDLGLYTGTWYEIMKIPNRFQADCQRDTTATYGLLEDGRLLVVNACTDANNQREQKMGVARVVDTTTRARLEVSFVEVFGMNLFWGDYWVLDLGPNYRYAIVGTPDRKYGWVLSRSKHLPAPDRKVVEQRLRALGYDPQAFVASPQSR